MSAVEFARAQSWEAQARCRDGAASLTALFFSEELQDIAAAKAFCAGCSVRGACLDSALARREPWGVWGGELFANGKVLAHKRKRGRPPKVRPVVADGAAGAVDVAGATDRMPVSQSA